MIGKRGQAETAETELAEVLKDFRASVHAWSEAEFARPRAVSLAAHRHTWRRALAWALGCVLAAGSLSAGVEEYHHRERLALLAAQRRAEQRQMAAQQRAAEAAAQGRMSDEKLMAAVDKDVSQEVPSAMEPLAQLMEEGPNQ